MSLRTVLFLLVCVSVAPPRLEASFAILEPPSTGTRVLIVAPHMDDEALAAAGYALDAVAAGAEVFVVYLTAGDHSRTALVANRLTFFATARLNRKGHRRYREALVAAERLGLSEENVLLLGYPDRSLRRMLAAPDRTLRSASTGKRAVPYENALSPGAPHRAENLARDLGRVLAEVSPDILIAPSRHDRHSDHRAAAAVVDEAIAALGVEPIRLGYVIHGRAAPTVRNRAVRALAERDAENWVVYPLSAETVREKSSVLAAYKSQRRSPYLRRLFHSFETSSEIFIHHDG